MKTMAASEFKAKCLAVLDEVARTGERVVVLKRGRPVAQVSPAPPAGADYPQEDLRGKGEIVGDIIGPVLPPDAWEAEHGKPR